MRRRGGLDEHALPLGVHGARPDVHLDGRLLRRPHLHQPRLQHDGVCLDGRPLQPQRGLLLGEQLRAWGVSGRRAELLGRVRHLPQRERLLRRSHLHLGPLSAPDTLVRNVETVMHLRLVLHGPHVLVGLLRVPERLPHDGRDVLCDDALLRRPHLHHRRLPCAYDLVPARGPGLHLGQLLQRAHVLIGRVHALWRHHLPQRRHHLQRDEPLLRRPLVRLGRLPVTELLV